MFLSLLLHLFCFPLTAPVALAGEDETETAEDDSVVRDPFDFIRKRLLDLGAGPGYTSAENMRIHNANPADDRSSKSGAVPLYDLRVGPVTVSNVYSQAGFKRGSGPRIGLLFSYTGDSYQPVNLAKREKSLFGGGFVGFKALTLYVLTDLLGRKAGVLYAANLAPRILHFGRNDLYLVLELEHMNRQYVAYYFGIRSYEASTLLPYYEGVRATNLSVTLLNNFAITRHFEFLLWGGQKRYGTGIKHSPTVGFSDTYYAGTGFVWRIF